MFLERERAQLELIMPGLDQRLSSQDVESLETRGSTVIRDFAASGGAGLLVARKYGGLGASASQATDALRAIGSRSASLAVSTTMHHYKVAWLAETLDARRRGKVLTKITQNKLFVASCGSEGRTADGTFNPGIAVRSDGRNLIVSGVKRPCSLVWDMGMLSMLVRAPQDSYLGDQLAILLIDARSPRLQRRELWRNDVLGASQTDEVELLNVPVAEDETIPLGSVDTSGEIATSNLLWFEVLITASYLGIASGVVEAAYKVRSGSREILIESIAALEMAYMAVRGLAMRVDAGERGQSALADGVLCRISAQHAIRNATSHALRVLGTEAEPKHHRAMAASRALAFHPGGLRDGGPALLKYYDGQPLALI